MIAKSFSRSRIQFWFLVLTLLVLELAFLAACGRPVAGATQSITPTTPAVRQIPCDGPVKVAVLPDQTPSATWTRTPQLQPRDFTALVALVVACGGEIGVTVIRDRRDFSDMVRLRIDARPLHLPVAPRKDQNPFQFNKEETRFEREELVYRQRAAQRQAEVSRSVDDFHAALGHILNHPAVHASAVCDALARGDLFLSEPNDGWWGTPQSYLLAVSDGADTYTKHHCSPLASGARLAIVNGSGSVASLGSLSPLRFESFDAAVDYIVRQEEK